MVVFLSLSIVCSFHLRKIIAVIDLFFSLHEFPFYFSRTSNCVYS